MVSSKSASIFPGLVLHFYTQQPYFSSIDFFALFCNNINVTLRYKDHDTVENFQFFPFFSKVWIAKYL